MPLRSFTFSRLRSFVAPARVDLAPVSLLFGRNNSGKSTPLRALKLLASSARRGLDVPLDLDNEAARGARWSELRTKLDPTNEMTLELEWARADGRPERASRFVLSDRGTSKHYIDTLEVRSGAEQVRLRVSAESATEYERLDAQNEVTASGPCRFDGVCPPMSAPWLRDSEQAALRSLRDDLETLSTSVHWLAGIRAPIQRRILARDAAKWPRSAGAWAPAEIARAREGGDPLFACVRDELERLFDCVIEARTDAGDVLISAQPGGSSFVVAIEDMGEGLAQALPVVTLVCMAELGLLGPAPILCLEQPEMHLHADAERRLADLLLRASRAPSGPRLLIETHSDIFVHSLLLAVAQRERAASDLALHWVSRERASSSRVERVAIDEGGRPAFWPAGALTSRAELARELFVARRR